MDLKTKNPGELGVLWEVPLQLILQTGVSTSTLAQHLTRLESNLVIFAVLHPSPPFLPLSLLSSSLLSFLLCPFFLSFPNFPSPSPFLSLPSLLFLPSPYLSRVCDYAVEYNAFTP